MSGGTAHGLGPFEPYWTDEIGPPRRSATWTRRLAFGLAAALAMIAIAAFAPSRRVAEVGGQTVVVGAPPAVAPPALTAPAIALEGFAADAVSHELNLDHVAAGRSDALTFGRLDRDGAALRVEVWADGSRRAALSLFVVAAETAAAGGAAVERIGATQALATSAGPVQWGPIELAGASGRDCAAFRAAPRVGGLRGVVCAASGAALDAASLGCLIDRLTVTKAGREAGFADVLKPPAKRAACKTPLG